MIPELFPLCDIWNNIKSKKLTRQRIKNIILRLIMLKPILNKKQKYGKDQTIYYSPSPSLHYYF